MAKCKDCPIRDTNYCHLVNPMAKKYTRFEKELIRYHIDTGKLNQTTAQPGKMYFVITWEE